MGHSRREVEKGEIQGGGREGSGVKDTHVEQKQVPDLRVGLMLHVLIILGPQRIDLG